MIELDRPNPDAPDAEASQERLAALCKAMGHTARVAIMRLLIKKNACIVGAIVDELPLAQSTVSQHLKQLKAAGLVQGTIDGPRICYCVDPAVVDELKTLIAGL